MLRLSSVIAQFLAALKEAGIFSEDCVRPVWSEWTAWSACDKTSGHGGRDRLRYCNNPSPAHGGITCDGFDVEADKCFEVHCPGDSFHLLPYFFFF